MVFRDCVAIWEPAHSKTGLLYPIANKLHPEQPTSVVPLPACLKIWNDDWERTEFLRSILLEFISLIPKFGTGHRF